VYVYVYVLVPSHINGDGASTVDVRTGVIGEPQASLTTSGVGAVASATQATVEDPPPGGTAGGVVAFEYVRVWV
jgi:hypothetical protein